jgi:2'-5' RNA ligase
MPRLFFALWPDASAAQALETVGRELAARSAGKPVPMAKIHLTLAFLGEVVPGRVDDAMAAGAAIRSPPLDVSLDTIGWFRGARVAWVGSSSLDPGLAGLQARLGEALGAREFTLDTRPFAAHVTVARKVARPVARASIAAIGWRARKLSLVRSETGTGKYETLAGWELG